MRCPSCASSRCQAVPVFQSRWYAPNVIDQHAGFACLDCGATWRLKPSAEEERQRIDQDVRDTLGMVGCITVTGAVAIAVMLLYFLASDYPAATAMIAAGVGVAVVAFRHYFRDPEAPQKAEAAPVPFQAAPEPSSVTPASLVRDYDSAPYGRQYEVGLAPEATEEAIQLALQTHIRGYSTARLQQMATDTTLAPEARQRAREELDRRQSQERLSAERHF